MLSNESREVVWGADLQTDWQLLGIKPRTGPISQFKVSQFLAVVHVVGYRVSRRISASQWRVNIQTGGSDATRIFFCGKERVYRQSMINAADFQRSGIRRSSLECWCVHHCHTLLLILISVVPLTRYALQSRKTSDLRSATLQALNGRISQGLSFDILRSNLVSSASVYLCLK